MKILDRKLPHDDVTSGDNWHEGVTLLGYHPESQSFLMRSGKCIICLSVEFVEEISDWLERMKNTPIVKSYEDEAEKRGAYPPL